MLIILATFVLCACLASVGTSGASFNSPSSSSIRVGVDKVQNWLHMYSQSTDPDLLTGYYQRSSGVPAATGIDETLAVNLGTRTRGTNTVCSRVFTIKTPASFPTGTSCTVTATLVADPTTGTQPINLFGFANVGTTGTYTNPVTLTAGQKKQVNLRVNPAAAGVTYYPKALITVTYTGMTATFYQYSVTLQVTGG
jgi:hypothetical protein